MDRTSDSFTCYFMEITKNNKMVILKNYQNPALILKYYFMTARHRGEKLKPKINE